MNGSVITFVKSSGGVGATSLAVQMACALRNTKTALLDLDVQFGSAGFQMDMPRAETSIVDLAGTANRLDSAMLKGAMVRPHDRFDLLCAPEGIPPMEDVTADGVLKIIDGARLDYDNVLIDMPMVWCEWSYAVLTRSNHIVLVTRLTVPALRQARRQMEMMKEERLNQIPLFIVANQVETGFLSGKGISKQEGESVLGRPINAVLPHHPAMRLAIDAGLPLSDVRGGRALSKKLVSMMGKILGDVSRRRAA
jgi:pilus assembly protein CpaE